MALAFVKDGGSNAGRAGAFTSMNATVPAGGHAVGNLVVVAIAADGGTPRTESVTDTGGNTWVEIEPGDGGGSFARRASIHASVLTTALAAGDTITANTSVAVTRLALACVEFSGGTITEDGASDNAVGSSATPSLALGSTPANAETLVIGALHVNGPNSGSYTEDSDTNGGSGWTSGPRVGTNAGTAASNVTLSVAWKITASAAAQTYNPSISSRPWTIAVADLEADAGGGGGSQVSNEWSVDYDIENAVNREWAVDYDIENAVNREWALAYDITNQIAREWSLDYSIAGQVSREWALTYGVGNQVSRTWALGYDITNAIAREWMLAYDIANAVNRTWALGYDIPPQPSQVSNEWAIDYQLAGQIAREWELTYILGEVNGLLLRRVRF